MGKRKEKQQFGPEMEQLKESMKQMVKEGLRKASSKWTWGVDLTEADLRELVWGADRQHQVPHLGYDQDLSSGALQSQTSKRLKLEDPTDQDLRFDDTSDSISPIPELHPRDFPDYSLILEGPFRPEFTDPESDQVIQAFTKRAKCRPG